MQARVVRIEAHKPCWREVSIQGHIVEADEGRGEHVRSPRAARGPESAGGAAELPGGPVSLREHLELERRVLEKLRQRGLQQQKQQQASETPA